MTRPIRFEHLQACIDWWGGAERKGRKETERAWRVTGDEVKARSLQPRHQEPAHARAPITAILRICWRSSVPPRSTRRFCATG